MFLFSSMTISACTSDSESACTCDFPDQSFGVLVGVNSFFDLHDGVECAQICERPIFLELTGYASQSTRKMEEDFLADKKITRKLNKDFIPVTLYVDDKTALPIEEQIEVGSFGNTKFIKTIGQKNSHFQTTSFQTNVTPFFVILSSSGEAEIERFGYLPNVNKVDSILNNALIKYESWQSKKQ